MKLFKRIFFIFILSSLSLITIQGQDNTYFLHTVEKGQSLYSISRMYEVSQEDIVRLNPGSTEKIYAGQALKIPQEPKEETKEVYHTIQPGETLYRLTQLYEVSAREITEENPGLTAENFRIGQVVRIPARKQLIGGEPEGVITEIPAAVVPKCKEMHKVKRKETIFSVSREYGITEQELKDANPELKEGMKRGQLLCIPYPVLSVTTPRKEPDFIISAPTNQQLFQENQQRTEQITSMKVALILPLEGDVRMLEYYEGFLMAVDSLKKRGISMDLHVYDSGNKQSSIGNILRREELRQMDIIFGPLYQEHIKPLSDFAETNQIRLVVPISRETDEVYQNPLIYQVNSPHSYLYSEVYEHFTRTFLNANVIILDMENDEADKVEFITGLKQELAKHRIPVQTVSGNSSTEALKGTLQPGKQNIFIPTSGANTALIKVLPQLKLLVREEPNYTVHLFGYPEWQTYTKDHLESFFELDTYFYSPFYTNNLLPSAKKFINSYHRWYSKEMGNTFPRYGMLGYDTAFFFLSGLAKYGTGLEANVSEEKVQSIQTGFKFERVNNWGGFINKNVYFVHLTKGYELIKMDFD